MLKNQFKVVAFGVMLFGLKQSSEVRAQPTGPTPVAKVAEKVEVTLTYDQNDTPHLNWNVGNIPFLKAIGQISSIGNLNVFVSGDIPDDLKVTPRNFGPSTADHVMEKLCAAANISCKRREGIWYIESNEKENPEKEAKVVLLDLNFQDVEVAALINLISEYQKIPVEIDPDLNRRLTLIRLTNISVDQAFQKIAERAQLTVTTEGKKYVFKAKE